MLLFLWLIFFFREERRTNVLYFSCSLKLGMVVGAGDGWRTAWWLLFRNILKILRFLDYSEKRWNYCLSLIPCLIDKSILKKDILVPLIRQCVGDEFHYPTQSSSKPSKFKLIVIQFIYLFHSITLEQIRQENVEKKEEGYSMSLQGLYI